MNALDRRNNNRFGICDPFSVIQQEWNKFIQSPKWRKILLVLSSVLIYLFIFSRFFLNNFTTMAIYTAVHVYQYTGLLVCIVVIEYQDYFVSDKVRCIEILFFSFILTPYSAVICIQNTTNKEYRDPSDSPFWFLIVLIFVPLIVVGVTTPFIDDSLDVMFMLEFLGFLVLFCYVTFAVMEKLLYKWRYFPYFNILTWLLLPFVTIFCSVFYCIKGKEGFAQNAHQNNQAQRDFNRIPPPNPVEERNIEDFHPEDGGIWAWSTRQFWLSD